jgi:hypothetical protein
MSLLWALTSPRIYWCDFKVKTDVSISGFSTNAIQKNTLNNENAERKT